MLLLSILEKFFLQDGAVSGRNEKDSRPGGGGGGGHFGI